MNKQHLPASPHWSARCYYAYGALAALFGMNLLNYVDRYVLAAVIKPVQDSFGIGDARGGVLFMAFMLSYALFSPLMGWLGDRMTRKYLLAAVRFLKHRPGQRHRGECHRTGGSGRSFRHQHPADALVGDLPSPVVMGGRFGPDRQPLLGFGADRANPGDRRPAVLPGCSAIGVR